MQCHNFPPVLAGVPLHVVVDSLDHFDDAAPARRVIVIQAAAVRINWKLANT